MLGIQLQWGRGSLAAAWFLTLAKHPRRARFNGAAAWGVGVAQGAQTSLASMGPRLISRGVDDERAVFGNALALQWGRGSLAAAWRSCRMRSWSSASFNGAAAH